EVVAVPLVRWAGIEGDGHGQLRAVAPGRPGERALQDDGRRKRCARVGERRAHAVPGVLEEPAATVGDRGTGDRIMMGERVRHPGGVLLPEASASLDVSEEEGHGLDGCRAHAPSLSRGWPTSRPGRPVRRPPRFLGFSSAYALLMNS